MDSVIIGQGYNLEENSSVGLELIKLFDSKRYTSFTCLVAFASQGGVSALTSRILEAKNRGVEIKVILGVDQQGTSKEALEEVLSWGVSAHIYHTADFNIFHPKIYLFENEDIFTLIVGSNNLTVPGLVQNVECSLMIKDIRSNPVLEKFYNYWGGILDGSEVNLYAINQDLIDRLYEDGIITSESQRKDKYDNGEDASPVTGKKNIIFNKAGVQRRPEGFVPARKVRRIKAKMSVSGANDSVSFVEEEFQSVEEQVLIAEIGGGPRWKQVNFPVGIFQDFFGARRGDNSYKINLRNIAPGGVLGEAEIRQAVTVKSNNFRFEIKCAETERAYPGKDNRPIGLFVKVGDKEFLYQVLMPGYPAYDRIRDYLVMEAKTKRTGELKRIIVDVEAVHALYPELII